MNNKIRLFALAAISTLMFAFPAVAAAGEPVMDPASGKFPLTFTLAGKHVEIRGAGEPSITCTASSGSGKYSTGTTGELNLTFQGCSTEFFGFPVSCNSNGQASGTVKTATTVFHDTYLTDAKTTPGILITPPTSEVITTIICSSFANVEIIGNGIIGHFESPQCGTSSKTRTLNFTATAASQTFKQVTGTGTVFEPLYRTEGRTSVTGALVAEMTVTFSENATLTCV